MGDNFAHFWGVCPPPGFWSLRRLCLNYSHTVLQYKSKWELKDEVGKSNILKSHKGYQKIIIDKNFDLKVIQLYLNQIEIHIYSEVKWLNWPYEF